MDPKHLLRQFLFRNKHHYIVSILSIFLAEVVTVQSPRLIGEFTNNLEAHTLTSGKVVHYAVWLLIVGALYVAFYGFGQFRHGQMARRFEYDLRRRLFDHWEILSTGYFQRRSIGDLLNHAMNDVQNVREVLAGGLNILVNAVFLLMTTLFMTFRTVSVKLTLVSMIPLLVLPLVIVWVGPRVRKASRAVQEGLSNMADLTEESITAIRVIKATANEPVEKRRFAERVDTIVSRQMSMVKLFALFQSVFPFVESFSFAVALLYGGSMVIEGHMALGSFVAFTLYLGMLITPLQQIGWVINNFQRASASLERLSVLLAEPPAIADSTHPAPITELRGDIAIDISSFTYPDAQAPALKDVSFTIHPGQTVGIVGRTASGKTTLANLIPRVFDPPPHSITIGDYDIRDIRLEVLRGAISYVPQDGFLFSTSIAENIGFGKETTTDEEIRQAAEDACIADDIEGFKEGYDTVIGERGVTLSGGQKQRTAIARALLKQAPILILDDCLSAVDMNTEKRIIERLYRTRSGKTTLIIAHRLSAVTNADLILVMEEGTIVERGTHDELLQQGGIYAQMYQLQQTDEEVLA